MALRRPLYVDGTGNPQVMTATQLDQIRDEVVRLFANNPAIILQYDSNGDSTTSIGTLLDTRLQAGAVSIGDGTTPAGFPPESTTEEPSEVTVTWDKIAETAIIVQQKPVDSDNRAFPVYWNGTGIQAMTDSDFIDTFISPAIDRLVSASLTESDAGGTFFISAIDSDSNGTLVSTLPIYTDTRADTTLYTAGGIAEVQDQPIDIQNYYLFKVNPPVAKGFTAPLYIRPDGNLQTYAQDSAQNLMLKTINWVTRAVTGSKIRYSLDSAGGPGVSRGTGIVNTRLTGGLGDYQTFQGGINDYRAQEFPDGTPSTIATTFLKIRKV